jgi:hypothetical protein
MLKYIISIGRNVFSFTTPAVKKGEKIDYKATFNHVKEIVGKEATVELA